MSFKDLSLESSYNSSRNNLVEEFYNPVLSEAVSYDRVTGFFNSQSLALAAKGLKKFIGNGGKMRLLCGAQLSFKDLDAIVNPSEILEEISNNFLDDLNSIFDEFQLNHIKILAWMVENNYLEIKIGIVKNDLGYVGGILHEKTGILLDKEGNKILFSGSNNETGKGWFSGGYGNIEKFKVFLGWEDGKFMDDDVKDFEDDWNNENEYLDVYDVPKAANDGLVKLAPKSWEELLVLPLSYRERGMSIDRRELRDYQKEAILKWEENGNRGIFEMATGTGKTFTALNCLSNLLENHSQLLTVISCPYAHLAEQWVSDIENFLDIRCYNIYASSNPKWKKDLSDLAFDMDLEIIDKAVILTTHNTFSSDFFRNEISDLILDTFLIVDEVHHVGSNSFSLGLLDGYDFRLGLSATPYIHNNQEATEMLFDYFDGIVFSYGIDEGIDPPGGGEAALTPYDYFPKKVELTEKELEDYKDLSKQISKLSHLNQKEMSDSYKALLIKRKNIVKNAKYKYDCLKEIVRYYDDIDHLIVFCSPQQIDDVLDILKEEGVYPVHRFTQHEGTRKSSRFGGLSHREYLVEKFDEGYFKSLVAIKCLDEGVDIPSADKVIIMASSDNPREYIQRRGRVLRKSEGKTKAEIYDMAVVQSDFSGELISSIIEPEKNRLIDFMNSSDNPDYCMKFLEKWRII